jgi:hypothetical protein
MVEVYMEKDRQKYEMKCQKKWNAMKTVEEEIYNVKRRKINRW